MFGQVDAVGQIAGGPAVGLIARFVSVVAAITASGLLLAPALLLVRQANERGALEDAGEAVTEA
jgi:DHA3 family tetracycline resistance protein-like MFS transporter